MTEPLEDTKDNHVQCVDVILNSNWGYIPVVSNSNNLVKLLRVDNFNDILGKRGCFVRNGVSRFVGTSVP